MDIVRKLNELDLEEDSMNDKTLDKSNYEMLVRANQEQQSSKGNTLMAAPKIIV